MKILFIELEVEAEWGLAAAGPAYIASSVRQAGHQAELITLRWQQQPRAILPQLLAAEADLIGFSLTTTQWPRAQEVAREIRHHLATPIIAGGLHATFSSESILESGLFDYCCIGEGELAVTELLHRLASGSADPAAGVAGIRSPGEPLPRAAAVVEDLDLLPFPDRDFLQEPHGVVYLSTQRGCPYPCSYCAAAALQQLSTEIGGRVRRRSVSNVLTELRQIRAQRGLSYVVFLDDTFTLDRAWIATFCRDYRAHIGVGFSANARAENSSEALLDQLQQAGCRHLAFGVESGSERVRREILRRPVTNQRLLQAVRSTQARGMLATVSYMIGVPGERPEEIEETMAFHQQLKPDDFSLFIYYPYPGTALYALCRERGYLQEGDPAPVVPAGRSVLRLPGLSAQQLQAYYEKFQALDDNWRVAG